MAETLEGNNHPHWNIILKEVWNSSDDGIRVTDQNGVILFVNAAFCSIVGFSEKELVNNLFTIIYDENRKDELLQEYLNNFNSNINNNFHDKSLKIFNRNPLRFNIKHKLVTNGTDKFMLSTFKNITDQKLAEADITATKKALPDVTKSEETFKRMADSINDGLTIIENGKIVYFNKRVLEIFNTTAEKFINKDGISYGLTKEKDRLLRIKENAITNNIIQREVSFWIKTDDGEKKHITNRYSPTIKNGERVGLVIITMDSTARKKSNDAIKKSQKRLRLLFNSTHDLIAMLNQNAAPVWVNKSFKKIFGENFDASTEPFSVFHHSHVLEAEKLWAKMRYSRTPIENVVMRLNVKHSLVFIEFSIYPSAAIDEEFYFIFAKNISERIKTEQELNKFKDSLQDMVEKRTAELRDSEEKYRALAENSQDVIMRFDKDLRHIYVNPEVKKQTGIEAEDFINKTHEEVGFPRHLTELWANEMRKVFDTGKESRIEFKLPNNQWIDWVVIPEFDGCGNVKSLVTSGRNITRRKQLETDAIKALQREKELSELKSRFIATTSHEFRTPLTSIKSSADIIRRYGENYTREKIVEHTNKISTAVDKMTDMISEVLKVSKAERTNESFNPARINLFDLIKDIVDTQSTGNKKHITIRLHSELQNKWFLLDEKLILSAIQNLIANSIKYSGENAEINVILSLLNDNLLVSIKDEGIGISEEDSQLIFEPFIRAKNVGDVEGTGLGLSIAKRAIEIHGGSIKVNSKLNSGSEFLIELPVIKDLN